jgi:hypothetical protein
MDPSQREKLETLDGSRSAQTPVRRKQAVRVADLDPLLQINERLTAAKTTGTYPSAAEFNKLVDDVQALQRTLAATAEKLAQKLR